jgi:hypothetical protein
MTAEKSVLVVGLDPTLIDFSQPGYAPGMDARKVLAGLKSSEDELTRLGYSVYRGRCTNEPKQLLAV